VTRPIHRGVDVPGVRAPAANLAYHWDERWLIEIEVVAARPAAEQS
jgi:hypothetical protein